MAHVSTTTRRRCTLSRMALDISFDYPGEIVIWSDSAYATSGLFRLLQDGEDIPDDAGEDLWTEIQ